ncbi:glutamine synthetase family protein [Ideonella sp.]|uniref:glutamine synthetase family protein n=1 Tax=Ideonella sp. TaxID=1929293 RepID=UPI002B46593C|nr:glutamine synthetase family protein [Ideonella sp.]HJV71210.1 glutamine synthetase family protein [Ideonella sp.]HSN31365.1 glutamine synthetase family protein [Ideonella sp.]
MSPLQALPAVDRAEAEAALARLGARSVECALGDFTSLARGKRVAHDDFLALGGCKLPSVVLGLTLTAGEPDAVFGPMLPTSYCDMHLVPDLATLAPRPGRAGEVTVLCEPTGRWWSAHHGREIDASELSPRAALRRVVAAFEAEGLQALVAPELELFLLHREEAGGKAALTSARAKPGAMAREAACEAFSLERAGHFEAYFDELFAACEALAIPLSGHAHESALSQFEVNFRPGAPLAQADAVFRFKRVAREIAARHGFLASFAAKPFLDQPGTGMHWHFSVQRRGGDWPHLFAHPSGDSSNELGHFIAGLQAHTPAAMAFFAPYDMAYDRIALSDASPSHASWGAEDRSLAFRIPTSGPSARRVENRLPGGDANPYLTVAATLGLGLAGLRAAQAPHPGADDAHALPRTLPAALDALEASATLRELFGAPLVDAYVAIKRHEHAERSALADPRHEWDLTHLIELA